MQRLRPLAALLVCIALVVPSTADAERAARVEWRWRKTQAWEYVLVPSLGAAMLVSGLALPGTRRPASGWQNGFDDGVRDRLRGRSETARAVADRTSDALYLTLTVYPGIVEPWLIAALGHKKPDVGLELFMIYGEAALSSGLVTVLTQGAMERARPMQDECARDPGYNTMCESRQISRSFVAGHVSMAANSAALTCVNQAHLPLYGRGVGGALACGTAIVAAGSTATLRLVADKHWGTDVLAGAALGALTGTLYPLLLHYGRGPRAERAAWSITPVAAHDSAWLVASGSW